MNMQIISLLLYRADGTIRRLNFKLGQVNIITGKSNTGKTAIVDIIEYCLGRSTLKIEGPIRDTVAWYGVIYQIEDNQVLIIKPAPAKGRSSQSEVYLEIGSDIIPPSIDNLQTNTNDTGIIEYLNGAIGISPNMNIVETHTRDNLQANIRHTSFYLYQRQNIIANPDILFYRQQEQGISQAIKDTLPYFLGAIMEDELRLTQELREARRELRIARRRLQDIAPEDGEEVGRGIGLLLEAQQVGILDNIPDTSERSAIINSLRDLLQWNPQSSLASENDQITQLQVELRELRTQFQQKNAQIKSAESFAVEARGYTSEATQQQLRLESINLIDGNNSDIETCPICTSKLDNPIAGSTTINQSLQRIKSNLSVVTRERPRLREHIQLLTREREVIRRRINDTENTLASLLEEETTLQQGRDNVTRAARVIGRISFYLEGMNSIAEDSLINLEIERLENKVNQLTRELDVSGADDILASILSFLSVDMTEWAGALELEYKGSPYRIDINKLTVAVDRPGRPILMNSGMGGGESWVGCHLIALLALHKYFIEQFRPVPNFIILDQPTQVYFPEEKYEQMEGVTSEISDEDRIAVSRMFNLFFNVCKNLYPGLQIIVLDHANIDTDEFQNALVEQPWRQGRALIPADWL